MFDKVADRYDLLNDTLSLGLDRRWRKVVARAVGGGPGQLVLDLAAGTGTSTRALVRAGSRCIACDFSIGMLDAVDVVFVTGAYGLGENVVQGKVDPDEFYVHKPTFLAGHRTVLRRSLGQKQFAMALDARRTSHPIQQKVNDESEAMTAFDGITYNKGQAFIRMLESYLGENAFRDGLRTGGIGMGD